MEKVNLKEREKLARKEAILDAALLMFSKKDYHDVTVDHIAEQVGLSKGTLYLYFKNKEDIFYSMIFEKAKSLLHQLEAILESELQFIPCLNQFVHTSLMFFQENEGFFKIVRSNRNLEDSVEHSKMHQHAIEMFSTYTKLVFKLCQRGQKQGVLREGKIKNYAKLLTGIVDSFIFDWVFYSQNENLYEETSVIVDLFLNGVRTPQTQD